MVTWPHVLGESIMTMGASRGGGCSPLVGWKRQEAERAGHWGPGITFKGIYLGTYFLQLSFTY
jgi:hypothetical protein